MASTPISQADIGLAYDTQRLGNLKVLAKDDPKVAARKAASEFEALFLQTLLKTMRETRFDGEEDSNALDTYRGMADQQLAQTMAKGSGMGLGEALYQQILKASGQAADADAPVTRNAEPVKFNSVISPRLQAALSRAQGEEKRYEPMRALDALEAPLAAPVGREDFVQQIAPHARQAAANLGVTPNLVVAHAALESGWGKRNIRNADGSNSHNLFGIKAGGSWQGKTTDIVTTEYENGSPKKKVERFRAYDNYGEAFADYAKLLQNNPRYAGALNTGADAVSFARGLARGGYATDPAYAEKLARVATGTRS
ncbi:flagellar assembly peptidoglycan hydrolase FlgJ [Microvirgula curvata]|mgnify:CR=1 FL=1|uniref:Peptidoglycan hydrolase FlgJ n=1 Tax=Microvirgula aerodenitrificans TaxID=57480 RepID=A0A2S0P7R6_9NEIS|nr:flagellar assembly peptidoglycan hydrolase FlgJ [Microvirgula aerodenitrificans]AVY93327.1 flagellar assembly peptidoglycan hydrolase FlgJ [Microvirgula aerodenitrificans]